MKKPHLFLPILFLLGICSFNVGAKQLNINSENVSSVPLKSIGIGSNFDVAIRQARPFELNPAIKNYNNVSIGDTLLLDLFAGKEYLSVIQTKSIDVNGVKVLRAKLCEFNFAYCFISINKENVFISVDIPEQNEKYVSRIQTNKEAQYLIQLDEKNLDILPDAQISIDQNDSTKQSYLPAAIQDFVPIKQEVKQQAVELKSAQLASDVDDSVQIDVLIVYTPAAKKWSDDFEGGIDNTISQAMAKANLVSENSKLGITFSLVHSTEVDYEESGDPEVNYIYLDGQLTNSQIDVNNLTEGNIPNVHTIRDIVAADLVVLMTKTNEVGGLGWLLINREGNEEFGFSLLRVQQASGLIAIHEIGHNFGAHHPKEQTFDSGPTVWSNWSENTWSAGWRWKGEDNNYYCTVMGYDGGWYYPDGNTTTQVPFFSDPNISLLGEATGDETDGNNARTIRETKPIVAAYREPQHKNTPTVYTRNIHDKAADSAFSGGCVTNEGTSPVTARGVAYSTSRMPTLDHNFTVDRTGKGSFNSILTGLELNKVYYIRAYATNSFGTTYGNQIVYVNLGGVSRDFITRWKLPDGQHKLELILSRKGDVNYSWESVPAGQSGSGTFPKGEGIVEIPNLPAGKTIRLSIAPSNFQRFYNFYAICPFPEVYGPDRENLMDVEQWGTVQWTSMDHAFEGCKKLNISATDLPDLNNVKKMRSMFKECATLNGPTNINDWNISSVNNMMAMFYNANSFNQNIGGWDVSNVNRMSDLFYGASVFNHDIGGWDVSNVIGMGLLFYEASVFNQNIGNWDVSKVSDMYFMFTRASSFNQDIGKWDVSNVSNMNSMFAGARVFNQDIGKWNVSNVKDMSMMFIEARVFNQDIGGWDVSNVTNMGSMFSRANSFNQNLGSWNVSKVTDMSWMFNFVTFFNQNLVNWDVSSVKNMKGMFFQATAFNQDISRWNVENVTDMTSMFKGANNFNQSLNNWDVSNVASMRTMFNCASVFNGDIGKWNVSKVIDMSEMFSSASIFNQDIGNWNVSSVTDMSWMFYAAGDFNQDIGKWNVSYVIDMNSMFLTAGNFNQDIGGWNVSKVKNMSKMFLISSNFNQDLSDWDVSNIIDMSSMFQDASSFNQNIGNWNISSTYIMDGMLDNCGMDSTNYSSTLIGWSSNPNTPDSLALGANGMLYNCNAIDARDSLIRIKGWTIEGDGIVSNLGHAGNISGETNVCAQDIPEKYTIPEIENATSYVWTLPEGATGNSSTNSITVDFGTTALSGELKVKGVNDCGESNETSLAITVNSLPGNAVEIIGKESVCQGETSVVYSSSPIENATSYVWTLPDGTTGKSTTNSITVDFGATDLSCELKVKVVNDCGESNETSLAITVNSLPGNVIEIIGKESVCQGENSVVYSSSPIENATSYVWTLPDGATGSSTTNSITVDFDTTALSGELKVKGVNDCGESKEVSLAITVNSLPGNADEIIGQETVCQGETSVVYSTSPIGNATEYFWTLLDGATESSTTNSITVDFGATALSGVLKVKGVNDCGESEETSLAITVNSLPGNATEITGQELVCQGETSVVYTTSSIENATVYLWALPEGIIGNSSTNSITVDFGAAALSGEIKVKGLNDCGESEEVSLPITVNPIPETPVITMLDGKLVSNMPEGNQWYLMDDSIENATESVCEFYEDGNYFVVVTLKGCSSLPSNAIFVVGSSSNPVIKGLSIKIYPNPLENSLSISIAGNTIPLDYVLINSLGETILKGSLIEETSISTNHLNPGIYFVKIGNEGVFEFRKLIKN
ncbi:MAG: BspA family leucine-rich repeat surface protein [Prolixibacteraceae bacterium]